MKTRRLNEGLRVFSLLITFPTGTLSVLGRPGGCYYAGGCAGHSSRAVQFLGKTWPGCQPGILATVQSDGNVTIRVAAVVKVAINVQYCGTSWEVLTQA